MSSVKQARDQYQDQHNPAHNVGQAEVEQAFAVVQREGKTPIVAYAEFDDQGGWQPAYPGNSDAEGGVGTSSLQQFTRLISQGHTDAAGHQHSGPTAVIISIDNGQTWRFASDVIASST